MAATPGQKGEKRPRHVMWQDHLRPCAVFPVTSEEFAPYYLAGIRHDIRQTTLLRTKKVREIFWQGVSGNLHFRQSIAAKSKTKLFSTTRKLAGITRA